MQFHRISTVSVAIALQYNHLSLKIVQLYRYWHEPGDAGKFTSSIVLDPTYGFGGDGSGSSGCISTGPFAKYTNSLGPGYEITNHCINRKISNAMSQFSSQSQVDSCM